MRCSFWNLLTGEPIERMMVKNAEEGGGVAWSPEGDLLATYHEGHVVLWDAATGSESRRFVSPPLLWLDFSPKGTRLAAWRGRTVCGECPAPTETQTKGHLSHMRRPARQRQEPALAAVFPFTHAFHDASRKRTVLGRATMVDECPTMGLVLAVAQRRRQNRQSGLVRTRREPHNF